MKEPIWLSRDQVLAFHEEQLREHGGLAGRRDDHALEGALARPRHQFHHEKPDVATLAASCAHGLAKNHPFNDGNKRVAFISAYVFLVLNGLELTLSEEKAVEAMLALASGKLDLASFAGLIRDNSAAS